MRIPCFSVDARKRAQNRLTGTGKLNNSAAFQIDFKMPIQTVECVYHNDLILTVNTGNAKYILLSSACG
jgi:hypothetical protein